MTYPPGLLSLLLVPGLSLLGAPEDFEVARDIQVYYSEGAVILSAPSGCHLKGRFLSVALVAGAGSLEMGTLPPTQDRDELGDPIYHGQVRLPLSGRNLSGNLELEVRFQPCTEGPQGVCYLPSVRRIGVLAQGIPPSQAPTPAPAATGAGLPSVQELGGGAFSLESFRGRVVLVDFWASWCGPCRKSFPALDRLNRKYQGQGLKVVGISLDAEKAAVTQFLESVPVGFQIAWDPGGQLAQAFKVASMPTTLLLDPQGRVVARFEGGGRIPAEEAAIAALLSGKALAPGSEATLAPGLRGTGSLKAWDRGHLADPMMSLDGDPLSRALWEHIHSSKEGAAGNGGSAGGGCGCN